jgi:GntR family transcriptional repressor for pyruvate dehydrogenase complex
VAERLRELVVTGELSPGQRLPTETLLAADYGVSRATVREALRLLAAQNLIKTAKGATGGSYVTLPSADHLSESLRSGIGLLAEAEDVSLEELLEVREVLEVPAARLAAARRREEDLEALHASIPAAPLRLGTEEQFAFNRDFHSVVIDLSRNTLLAISAQPVFSVLQTKLARSRLGPRFHRSINDHHRSIAAAIAAGDADAAGAEMLAHLEYLRPFYEKAWRRA